MGANRIALLTPYTDDINEVVESFISGRGVDIAVKGAFKQRGDPNITRVPPKAIYDAALELGQADVEGVFISCTALRVSSVLEPLEQALGKPVVSSNQAMAWHCLRLAGYDDPVSGYGRLLTI